MEPKEPSTLATITSTDSSPNNDKNMKTKEVNEMTEIFGEFGRWQVSIGLLVMLSCTLGCWNVIGYSLFTYPMSHWCARPTAFENLTIAQWKNLTIPLEVDHGKTHHSKCFRFDLSNVSGAEELLELAESGRWNPSEKVHCESWEFDKTFYKTSVIEKWNLTCENSWLASLGQSIYMTGFLLAVLLFGQLGDKIGRRPVMLICVVLQQIAGFGVAFSTSFIFFVITRFFVAMGTHGLYTTGFVVLIELVGAKFRPKMSVMLGLGWSIGFITLPALGYLTRSWFIQQLVVAISSLSLTLCWWFLPESPRWLITQGKLYQAQEIIEKAAKMNGKAKEETAELIDLYFRKIEAEKRTNPISVDAKRPSLIDLLRTPNMRKKTLNMFFAWFVTSFVYYGLSLNTHALGGNPLINLSIAGALEFPCLIAGYLTITYMGRCKPLSFVLLFGAGACLLTIPIGDDLVWLRVTLAMLGKCGVSVAFGIVYIYSAELFPTVVRNVGVGSSSTCARVGAIIAPFVKELGKATTQSVPLAVFGGVTAVSGILVLLLPETMNKILPDTMEEAEQFGLKKKKNTHEADLELEKTATPQV